MDVLAGLYDTKRDKVVPDESSKGWKSDAHKNLPAFKLLFETYPNADWYVMIDDDTYVFLDNLAHHLSLLNPNGAHYLGKGTVFKGCDNVREFGQGPTFGHGGSGIILSRGAMLKMMAIVDTCITKYRPCWAGDIRTALCLRDADVLLTSLSALHGDPPNEDFNFGNDLCQRPITFHHLLPHQIQKLADLENRLVYPLNATSRPVTLSDIYMDWHPVSEFEVDIDRTGNDFESFQSPSSKECRESCQGQSKCKSFTFDGEKCWLKDGIPKPTSKPGMVSGVLLTPCI